MNAIAALAGTPLVLPLAPVAVLALLCVVYLWRAGSMNSIFERIWHLVAGRVRVANKELEEFVALNRDLEKFRLMYRLRVDSQAQLRRLIGWCNEYDIPVTRLQRARYWVRAHKAEIVAKPSRWELAGTAGAVVVAALCMVWASGGANDPLAQLTMKESGTNFRTDGGVIRLAGGNGESFDLASCGDRTARASIKSMPQTDLALLCESDARAQLPAFAERAVREQRWLYGSLGVVSLLFLLACARYFSGWCEARDIWKLLSERDQEKRTSPEHSAP